MHGLTNLKIRISKSTKMLPVEADLFMRTDGQTDMSMLTVAFSNFANAPKK